MLQHQRFHLLTVVLISEQLGKLEERGSLPINRVCLKPTFDLMRETAKCPTGHNQTRMISFCPYQWTNVGDPWSTAGMYIIPLSYSPESANQHRQLLHKNLANFTRKSMQWPCWKKNSFGEKNHLGASSTTRVPVIICLKIEYLLIDHTKPSWKRVHLNMMVRHERRTGL